MWDPAVVVLAAVVLVSVGLFAYRRVRSLTAAVSASEARYRRLAESLPQLVWTDRPDGFCDYLSPQWVRYTGVPEAEQLGYGWVNQLHPDDRDRAAAAWDRAVTAGTDFEVEFRIRRADGAYRWFQTRAVPLRDEAGAVVKWFGTNTDIDDLKRTEQALRDSRAMHQLVLDTVPMGVVWKDTDSRYLGCNRTVSRAMGLAGPAAIVGLTDADFPSFAPGQAEAFVRKDREVMGSGTPALNIEEPMTVADGTTVWLETNKVPIRDAAGRVTGVLGTWTDITARKRTTEALARSEARFRGAFDHTDVAMVLTDLDNRFVRANAAFARLFGYSEAELAGMAMADVTHPDHLAESYARREELLAGAADHFVMEKRYRHKDGHVLWGLTNVSLLRDPGGRPVQYVGQVQDITARKRVEAADRRLAGLVEGMSEACYMVDAGWRFTFVNDRCEAMLGRTVWELFTRLNGTPMEGQFRAAMADRTPLTFVAFSPTAGRWLDVRVFPTGDGLAAFLLDVHDRKLAEEEVRRLNADLEERVRERTAELEAANRELEAFSYSVSHDLRSPLRAIDGFSRIVVRDHAAHLPDEARDLLADVRAAAGRMSRLIDDLLALSRLGRKPVRKQPVDTTALVRRCLAELPPADPGRRVELTVGELPSCEADPALLKQVWLNLLANALKYTGPRNPAVIEVGGTSGSEGPTYYVKDNGVGFDMKYAGKLFGVFQRMHRAEEFEGTGVGLAVVQRIVHRHGGRVWAEAEPDRGAAFFFTLTHTLAAADSGGIVASPG